MADVVRIDANRRPGGRWRERLPEIALIALALVLYVRTVAYPFLFDDTSIVAANRYTESLANIPRIFSSGYWDGTDMNGSGGLYRPVAITVYALQHALYGKHPFGYHVVNVLLHALNTLLAYRLFKGLLSGRTAWIGAALFAVHPVHVEAVVGIVGCAELFSATLLFSALLLHRRWRPPLGPAGGRKRAVGARDPDSRGRTPKTAAADATPQASPGGKTPWIAAGLFLVANLTKESSLAAVGVLAAYELTFRYGARLGAWARALRRDALRVYGPWLIAAALALAARWAVLGYIAREDPLAGFDNPMIGSPAATRWPTALRVFAEYVRLAVVPLRLSTDYSSSQVPVSSWHAAPVWAGAALAAAACVLLAIALVRRSPLLFPALWCAFTYALIGNVFVLIGTIVAERLLYLPSAGFCMLIAAALAWRPVPARRALAAAVPGLVIAALGAQAFARVGDWRSEKAVIEHDVRSAPNSARVHSSRGRDLFDEGRMPEAVAEFDRAIAIAPQWGEPYLWKAFVATGEGNREKAVQLYVTAIHSIPSYATEYEKVGRPLLGLDLREEDRLYRAGKDAQARGDFTAAAEALQSASMLAPDADAARRLASCLLNLGRAQEAQAWAERSLLWDPANGEGHWLVSGARFALGDWEGSRLQAEEALRLGFAVPPDILARLRRGR